MTFYGAATFVLHCLLLWPLRGFPHFEHVYVFRFRVASFTAGWTIDCSSASVERLTGVIAGQCQPLNETLKALTKVIVNEGLTTKGKKSQYFLTD